MWENVALRLAYVSLGAAVGIGGVLIWNPFPPQTAEKEIVIVEKTKTITKTEWKTNTVIKWKEKQIIQPDGTTTTERESVETTAENGSTQSSAESTAVVEHTEKAGDKPSYVVGFSFNPLTPKDIYTYRLSLSARIGDLPLFIGGYGQLDGTFGVGVQLEF